MILAGDVGATKILLEVGESRDGRFAPALAHRYAIADFPDITAALEAFLREWQAVAPRRARVTAAAIGVAGPAIGNRVKMTNRPWIVDGDILARRFKIPQVTVLNDLAAAAHGLEALAARDFAPLQPGRTVPGEPRVLLGVGTGLGVAYLLGDPPRVLPGEGGHVGFSPASVEQAALWDALFAARGRVEAEDVISGVGITNIYEYLRDRAEGRDAPGGLAGAAGRADPAWISAGARERGDPTCAAALELFSECLGNVAGDHALAVMARGGVYLAGGVIARIAPSINNARFRAAFCAKGLMSSLLMRIPVRAVVNERAALLGAARVAGGG